MTAFGSSLLVWITCILLCGVPVAWGVDGHRQPLADFKALNGAIELAALDVTYVFRIDGNLKNSSERISNSDYARLLRQGNRYAYERVSTRWIESDERIVAAQAVADNGAQARVWLFEADGRRTTLKDFIESTRSPRAIRSKPTSPCSSEVDAALGQASSNAR